jgi:hypothetical protein
LLLALSLAFVIAVLERVALSYVHLKPAVELPTVVLTFFLVFIVLTRVGGAHSPWRRER